MLAGGCIDGRVVVWDFETHGVSRTFHLHVARVKSVSWTRSSQKLLSASADSELILWEVRRVVVASWVRMSRAIAMTVDASP